MKNWKVLQKKISEMNEKEFIEFANEQITCLKTREVIGYKGMNCGNCKYSCKYPDCEGYFLQDEYQEPKKEKWIVHRTLRTQNIEVYISNIKDYYDTKVEYLVAQNCGDTFGGYGENIFSCKNKDLAYPFNLSNAIRLRDLLNKYRAGKQYLWVVSKVEE